eukprot:5712990-Amphidinium_carterae.1
MGSARAPFRWTMKLASCYLHQPSARNLACLSGNHHPTHIRVRDHQNRFGHQLEDITNRPSRRPTSVDHSPCNLGAQQ